MNGGGPLKLGAGQISSISEMMMAQIEGILKGMNKYAEKHGDNVLSLNDLAKSYTNWHQTKPFRLEDTILVVFNSIINGSDPYTASQSMPHSQTNTALMRIFPIAIWTSALRDTDDIVNSLAYEVELTHSNQLTVSTNILFGQVIHYLLNLSTEPDRAKKSFQLALQLCETDECKFEDPESFESCKKWLLTSQELSNVV